MSGGGSLSAEVLAERLPLVIYAYGTNTGIKAVAPGGHGHTEDELRYVRHRYLSAEAARAIADQTANATFAARSTELWGQGSTAHQMIKYATAIRTRTASTEAVVRRFTRNASHPTYAAMLEVGRAQKTIFVARYLRLRDLQREIEEGLNVMESSNGANSVIAYGKGGEIASNRRDEQEMFVLCLRILQSALVYVNTLMLQDILGEPEWAELLTPADRRGLTPLFWSHVRPYGEVTLDMDTRLDLAAV
ncbi:Tn3 family transposase [Streptomyces sp. NPDC059340]|uniref:Tn3 family transposase n=1 Tax=Streptomyces sp. NPDC059340 TaxID=3346806 RepID=UPI00367ACF8B